MTDNFISHIGSFPDGFAFCGIRWRAKSEFYLEKTVSVRRVRPRPDVQMKGDTMKTIFKTQERAAAYINRDVKTIGRWQKEGILQKPYDSEQLIRCVILKSHWTQKHITEHLEMFEKLNYLQTELEKIQAEFHQFIVRKKQKSPEK
jgi:hypothetical protein